MRKDLRLGLTLLVESNVAGECIELGAKHES